MKSDPHGQKFRVMHFPFIFVFVPNIKKYSQYCIKSTTVTVPLYTKRPDIVRYSFPFFLAGPCKSPPSCKSTGITCAFVRLAGFTLTEGSHFEYSFLFSFCLTYNIVLVGFLICVDAVLGKGFIESSRLSTNVSCCLTSIF